MEGNYQCTQYIGTPNENDWHHVTISAVPGGDSSHRLWSNKAGAKWKISSVDGTLYEDCPYYSPTLRSATLERNAQGVVTTIIFQGERYDRVGGGASSAVTSASVGNTSATCSTDNNIQLEGRYQCTQYIGTPNENGYHRVSLRRIAPKVRGEVGNTATTAPSSGLQDFQWKNDAGVQWTISSNGAVHKNCPYYSDGVKTCTIEMKPGGTGEVAAVIFHGERYDNCGDVEATVDPLHNTLAEISQKQHLSVDSSSPAALAKVLFVPVSDTVADWRDFLYLAALPISSIMNTNGNARWSATPTVVVSAETLGEHSSGGEDDDALLDFLGQRLGGHSASFSGHGIETPLDSRLHFASSVSTAFKTPLMKCSSLASGVVSLLDLLITSLGGAQQQLPRSLVVADTSSYSSCLLAASVAGLSSSPIIFSENGSIPEEYNNGSCYSECFSAAAEVVFVGPKENMPPTAQLAKLIGNGAVRHLPQFADAAKAFPNVDYVTIANPNDRVGSSTAASSTTIPQIPKLSLVAPALAIKHRGLVFSPTSVPISPTGPPTHDEPTFRAMRSAFTKDLLGGLSPEKSLRYICLVGSPDAVPALRTGFRLNNEPTNPPTDYCYALRDFDQGILNQSDLSKAQRVNGEGKGFADFAVGRIFTHSFHLAALLAARCCTFEYLQKETWQNRFIEAGAWGYPELRPIAQRCGLSPAEVHKKMMPNGIADPIRQPQLDASKSLETSIIAHKAHSYWSGLGDFVDTRTKTLFAPCVFLSRGCHSCGIDEGTPSVASRVMGRGAVCYTGSPRSPDTQNQHFDIEFFNALLVHGFTIGEANAYAYNRHLLMKHERNRSTDYSVFNRLVLGDPALCPFPSSSSLSATQFQTTVVPSSDTVSVEFTGKWEMVPTHEDQLVEWSHKPRPLLVPVATGASPSTVWSANQCDSEEMSYVVSVPIHPQAEVSKVMLGGRTIQHYVTEFGSVLNNNRTNTTASGGACKQLLWRIPSLLEYNENTGQVASQFNRGDFKVEFSTPAAKFL